MNIAYVVPIVTFSFGFLIGFGVMCLMSITKGRDG